MSSQQCGGGQPAGTIAALLHGSIRGTVELFRGTVKVSSSDDMPQGALSCQDLVQSISGTDKPVSLITPVLQPTDKAVRGRLRLMHFRSGLSLHTSDIIDLHDMVTQAPCAPELTVVLFLRGQADIALGRQHHQIPTRQGPRLFVLAKAETDLFTRRGHRGDWQRKVAITAPRDWLQDTLPASLRQFCDRHGASATWAPPARLVALAEKLASAAPSAAPLQNLWWESHALEILASALSQLADEDGNRHHKRPDAREQARIQTVCEYLRAFTGDDLHMADLAQQAGMSVSTLQRLFHAVQGTTVFEYYRTVRMERAQDALARAGVSVTEAAYIAGYASPASFATAFKRRFGQTPRAYRAP